MTKTILVVGGAGYIGSHMTKMLLGLEGYRPVVVDNLGNGSRALVPAGVELNVGDIGDPFFIDAVIGRTKPAAVMHFASFIQVGESVGQPHRYYDNNLARTLVLLNAMLRHDVRRLIFSSTAAIFGNPLAVPIDETHPKNPINPYGRSKWMVEQILEDYGRAYGLRSISLRYFNAAGADPEGVLGECHEPETHLIPLVLQAAAGRRPNIAVFGDDYDTPDGTCIRDYIHVWDLCDAHRLALATLLDGSPSRQYNLGSGTGFSVAEVISCAEKICQRPIARVMHPRREGDPPILVADSRAMERELGWSLQHTNLETIIRHAWHWELTHFAPQSR